MISILCKGEGGLPRGPPQMPHEPVTPRKAVEYFFLDRKITTSSDKFNFQPGKSIITTRKVIIWQTPLFLISTAYRVYIPVAMKGLKLGFSSKMTLTVRLYETYDIVPNFQFWECFGALFHYQVLENFRFFFHGFQVSALKM